MACNEKQLEVMEVFQELAGILESHGLTPHIVAALRSYGDELALRDVLNFVRATGTSKEALAKAPAQALEAQLYGLRRLLGQVVDVMPVHRCPEGSAFFNVRLAKEKLSCANRCLDSALREMGGNR